MLISMTRKLFPHQKFRVWQFHFSFARIALSSQCNFWVVGSIPFMSLLCKLEQNVWRWLAYHRSLVKYNTLFEFQKYRCCLTFWWKILSIFKIVIWSCLPEDGALLFAILLLIAVFAFIKEHQHLKRLLQSLFSIPLSNQ